MVEWALAALMRPCTPQTFVADIWGRRPHCWTGVLEGVRHELLNLASFEQLVASLPAARDGWLHLTQDGGRIAVPPHMIDPQGMIDLRKLRIAFAAGATLYLTKAERLARPLMDVCRAVERDLCDAGIAMRESVGAHVFVTPPGTQGFALHRDAHASFVLQLEGTKAWTVYPPVEDPNPQPGPVDATRVDGAHTYELGPGDVLYMPEWWPHEARASGGHSLHVTLRLFPLRWAEIVQELCSGDPLLQQAVASGVLDRATFLASLRGVLRNVARSVSRLPLHDRIVQQYTIPRTAIPGDGLRQVLALDSITCNSRLIKDRRTVCRVIESGEDVCLAFPGGALRGSSVLRPVFEFVASATSFTPADLPRVAAADYDPVAIARALVRDGAIRLESQQAS